MKGRQSFIHANEHSSMRLVTKMTLDSVTGELRIAADYNVWSCRRRCWMVPRVHGVLQLFLIFDVLSALMFSRLESWRREAAFKQAIIYARNQQYADGSITYPAAEVCI